MLIAHKTVRAIAELVGLTVEEVTHELEGWLLCAPSGLTGMPLPRSVPAALRGVESPRSGLPSDKHMSSCTPTTVAAYIHRQIYTPSG